ncbi:MAG: glycosyltransferase [Candidatus Eisenbacteria bacterium]
MRICFLADAGSVNTRSWVNAFAEDLGHDVHVVSVNRVGEMAPSVTLHHLGTDSGTQDTLGKLAYLRSVRRIRRIVTEISPDILVGYRVASYGYVGARTGFRPLVVVAQGEHIITPRRSLPKRIFAMTAIREASLLHSWAPHVTDRLVELGADPDRILTCHRGIDIARFSPADEHERVPASVIVTRNLCRWYKIDVIVRALALARQEVGGITGTLAGDGEGEQELRELTGELGLSDVVRFIGRVPHDELPGLLRRSSIYASAVRTDGVSASLLEAMATGCFPVVRDNAANRYWVENGRNGFLVKGEDPAAYAEAIVAASRGDGLRSEAARLNRDIVAERADSARNMRTIERAYLALISGEREWEP